MNYTILSTEDVHSDQFIDLGRSGNKWTVSYIDKNAHDHTRFTTATFNSFEAAFERYAELVKQMAQGNYSPMSRKIYLLSGQWSATA